MARKFYDIGVIIPLEEELEEFLKVFPSKKNLSDEDVFLHEVESGVQDLSIVLIHQNDMGRAEAGAAANLLVHKFSIGLLVCLGIAGSLSDDVKIGDVCYTGRLLDVYDNNKTIDGDSEGKTLDIEFSSSPFETNEKITRALNYSRTQPDVRPSYLSWVTDREAEVRRLVPGEIIGRDGKLEDIAKPKSHNGTIVCGMVSKSKHYNDKLKAADRRVLAIETESGAVFKVAKENSVQALSIRGISDYADRNKGKLESESKGAVREIAAANAVTFFQYQLKNSYFLDQLRKLKQGEQQNLDLKINSELGKDSLSILGSIDDTIDARLREFSPEYRLQPKGYRVPTPRVKRHETYQGSISSAQSVPISIQDALKADKKILLSVPKSYPDKSLPWLLAHELIDSELDAKQIIPVVIGGDTIAPPNAGIDKQSPAELSEVDHDGHVVVYIVEKIPLNSETRVKFLMKEVLNKQNCYFIFISNFTPNYLAENEFKIDLGLSVYNICNISFLEMSNFIQRSFDLSGTASEVVAKRLWDTFSDFDLSAHPTYFAGIPKETLMALLHANRRAELIQLAVDGFLTLIVVDDPEDVSLSRTTRSRFLSDLAVEINIDKKKYSRSELVEMVQSFAEHQDFDIDPINFIKGFEDKGILHFDENYVEFSLPFIERYLLAKKLADNQFLAEKYFKIDGLAFDPHVFDLYAELGAHQAVKDDLLEAVESSLGELHDELDSTHILLSNTINPQIITSVDRIRNLQNKLNKAFEEVRKGESSAAKKQKILDLVDNVKNTTAKHVREEQSESRKQLDIKLEKALTSFTLAAILLGSGAEHLNASEKRNIAQKLVDLGSCVVDVWTRQRQGLDFAGLKDDLLSEESLEEFRDYHGDIDEEEAKSFISAVIDMMEGAIMSEPLSLTLRMLCEQARSRVLAKSLLNTAAESDFGELLKGVWLLDVDPVQGTKPLKKTIKALPHVTFLRSFLSMHCLSRAIWSHWKKKDRLDLLDIAEAFLEPISRGMPDKSKYRRQINATKEE